MIASIRIRNYKGVRSTPWIELDSFHVLVGPNGSGKSTFLDAIEFIKSCLVEGPPAAVEQRAPEYRDLTYLRQGGPMEFDLKMRFPDPPSNALGDLHYRFGLLDDERLGIRITEELLSKASHQASSLPGDRPKRPRLLGKTNTGSDFYQRETGTYQDTFQFGPGKLALSLTPPDTQKYPSANRVKNFLTQGVRFVQLNSPAMRQPAAATRSTELELDGTNLARVVGSLLRNGAATGGREALARWTEHLRYALEDLESIGWAARQPDNAEYLVLRFDGGLECPSWLLSDGTLRMLALTLPAFVPGPPSLYMVEEPENGVHPHALEIILKALAAIPSAQVFVATHSPMVVQQAGVRPLLCFTRGANGIQIVHGKDHPALKQWDGTPDLASIFASRVLG
ncbi:MAG TPA: AAA family ATPase [Bryobacteraceae bacterium]|jgi:predicted ATPase|nr:AAA family ATPase [Bryobacteraceae bacterium]